MIRSLCICGEQAQSRATTRGYFMKCTFCGRRTETYTTEELARRVWVKARMKLGRRK